jgi:hypothetical protein
LQNQADTSVFCTIAQAFKIYLNMVLMAYYLPGQPPVQHPRVAVADKSGMAAVVNGRVLAWADNPSTASKGILIGGFPKTALLLAWVQVQPD